MIDDRTTAEPVPLEVEEPRIPALQEIARAAAQYFRTTMAELRGKNVHKMIAYQRHVTMFLCRVDGRRSFPEIGHFFGRDHTSVMHADRRIFKMRETGDAQLERDLKSVRDILVRAFALSPPSMVAQDCRKCQELREANARQREEVLMLRQELAAMRVRFGCD